MTFKNTPAKFALGLPLILSLAAAAFAQTPNGAIRGTVLDPSGALIPGAQITITSESGFSRTLQSNGTGAFEVPQLAPGSYSVNIDASGFTPALEGIKVAPDRVTEENIKLGISVDSEIDVTADDPGK